MTVSTPSSTAMYYSAIHAVSISTRWAEVPLLHFEFAAES
jgi:hypothetical protein